MTTSEEQIIRETIRAFRQKCVEREWEHLDYPELERYLPLWQGLEQVGVTSLAGVEDGGDASLSARARYNLFSELGAAVPALGFGLIAHHAACRLIVEACRGNAQPEALVAFLGTRVALLASPLDPVPETHFELHSNGRLRLSGAARVAMPFPESIVLHAQDNGRDRLVVLPAAHAGLRFVAEPSSHGLRLVPFGELRCDGVDVDANCVFEWPSSGRVAREADGLLTSLLSGMVREMAERAMAYALTRYQGGKMIYLHDAVRDLLGPMVVTARSLEALAISTLDTETAGDGGASAFAVDVARNAGLDAMQVFGGYGYMEDYRVERYLRDANTLENFWVHSAQRRRTIVARRFSELSAQETP